MFYASFVQMLSLVRPVFFNRSHFEFEKLSDYFNLASAMKEKKKAQTNLTDWLTDRKAKLGQSKYDVFILKKNVQIRFEPNEIADQ